MIRLFTACFCLFLFCSVKADDSWKKPGKGPLKVFIMAGQSNMEGHGLSDHIKMAAEDSKTAAEFAPFMDSSNFVIRKDVWISYGNRRGGLSVGYGVKGNKVGPEIGFGRHIGELVKEQVLLIKTCWGGHSLKEKFLPPSMGGPGPSYTQMVKEIKDVLTNLKKYFPEYDQKKGYEIVGLVWHQAWNDMIDKSQKGESPPYKLYTERQGALLRDLRKEFDTPGMLMVVGECGVGGGNTESNPFRVAQRRMTLEKEFAETTRFVPTGIYWDEDKKFNSNGGYHYNGNGKIYYYKGKAMAHAMYELMPKVTFTDLRREVDRYSKPSYTALTSKRYAIAALELEKYKKYVESTEGKIDKKEFSKLQSIYDAMQDNFNEAVNPAVEDMKVLRRKKDWYAIFHKYPVYARMFKGVPAFDKAVEGIEAESRDPAVPTEVKIGKIFYNYVSRILKYEQSSRYERNEATVQRYEKYLESYIINKSSESVYAKAALKLIEDLKNPESKIKQPVDYIE